MLAAVGGSRYTPDIGLRRRQNRNYIYECKNCHFQYPRVRKVNTKKYRCGKCGGRLTLIRKINKNLNFHLLKEKLSGILFKYRGRGGMADAQD